MELIAAGKKYEELPDSFVIFICDFDPFGYEKYQYSFHNRCTESREAELDDGNVTILLSTKGKNKDEVSDKLVKFLRFVAADLDTSKGDFGDEFVGKCSKLFRKSK